MLHPSNDVDNDDEGCDGYDDDGNDVENDDDAGDDDDGDDGDGDKDDDDGVCERKGEACCWHRPLRRRSAPLHIVHQSQSSSSSSSCR